MKMFQRKNKYLYLECDMLYLMIILFCDYDLDNYLSWGISGTDYSRTKYVAVLGFYVPPKAKVIRRREEQNKI